MSRTTVLSPPAAERTVAHRPLRRAARLLPMAALLALAAAGPLLTPHDPLQVAGPTSASPGGGHWMGTDSAGLDVFSQVLAATRTNLLIASLVVLLASLGGMALGLLTGMNESASGVRGAAARAVARAIEFVQAVPAMLVGLVAVAFYGSTVTTLVCALSVILAPLQARLVRTEVLRVRSEAFVDAARMGGMGEAELTVRHVLPNSCRPALEYMSVIFAVSIILTASLGFLGAGLPPPTPEWGSMISRGATDAAAGRWWSAAFPTAALIISVAIVATTSNRIFGRGSR